MFEDEYSEIQKRPLNVEWLMMDSNILLPPTGTPMTGIEFSKRLPCGEVSTNKRKTCIFFQINYMHKILKRIVIAIYCKKMKPRMIVQVERARRAIRVFFLIRELALSLNMEAETQLPLTNPANCVQVNNVLDLSKN